MLFSYTPRWMPCSVIISEVFSSSRDPEPNITQSVCTGVLPLDPLTQEAPAEEQGERLQKSEGIEYKRRTGLTEPTKQGSHGLTERAWPASLEPAWVRTRCSAYMLGLLAWCFCGTPNYGSRYVFDSFASCWDYFPPAWLPCLVSV